MSKAITISYVRPPLDGKPKAFRLLAKTDRAFFAAQIVGTGGENNLHSHRHTDGFWFVLSGRVRFYTTGDEVIGEYGPMEGVVTPHDFPYWFESVGDTDLELLQFEASDQVMGRPDADRVDHAPKPEWMRAMGI